MVGFGIHRFDSIYFINLNHRKDRFEHITTQLKNIGADPSKIHRIEAIHTKNFGILGCGKSHILAVETFLKNQVGDNCLILEDDFAFCMDKYETNCKIEQFFDQVENNFDIFMLSSNVLQSQDTEMEGIKRIIDGQTLSAYCVTRKYAPKLLENFKQGVQMLETLGYSEHDYCVDIHIKKLQPTDRWYYTIPKIGKQIESYSDIQETTTNHQC